MPDVKHTDRQTDRETYIPLSSLSPLHCLPRTPHGTTTQTPGEGELWTGPHTAYSTGLQTAMLAVIRTVPCTEPSAVSE